MHRYAETETQTTIYTSNPRNHARHRIAVRRQHKPSVSVKNNEIGQPLSVMRLMHLIQHV